MTYLAYIFRKIAQNPRRAAHSGLKYVTEYLLDRRIGVSTFRRDFASPASPSGDSRPCQPAPYEVLADIAGHLRGTGFPLRTFMDVGCGAGRPLAYFSSLGFERMTGIEINPEVAARARENVARIKPAWNRAGRIDILTADVLTADLDFTDAVVYLANPFGRATMQAFAAKLKAQLQAQPDREILLYYVLPLQAEALAEAFPRAQRLIAGGPLEAWQFFRLDRASGG
jgi:SAM-dependent methyltransferase